MANVINLYEHQLAAVEQLRQNIRVHGPCKQMLMASCGAGKTVMGAFFLQEALRNYKRAAFVVDRINLLDQTSALLDFYGIDHGVIQAGHPRYRPYERIQVCSAQTLEKRGYFPDLDLLIVDEAHATRKGTLKLMANMPKLVTIGLSATPFTKGLKKHYPHLVNVITTNQLIAIGKLVPLKVYASKTMDMSGARIVAGEWSLDDIEKRGIAIVGDIVAEWSKQTRAHFGGPVKTIVFSATVDHGEELCRQFNAAGFNFQQISYRDSNDDHRRALIAEFRKPDSAIHGLVSCEVFTKGFDVPDILCGVGARPYRKSLSSHEQQTGRVRRTADGKTYGIWLDFCGNVLRFQDDVERIAEHGLTSLDDAELDAKSRKEPSAKEIKELVCSCGYVLPAGVAACPSCGKSRVRQSLVKNVAGELVELGKRLKKDAVPDYLADPASVWRQLCGYASERKEPLAASRWAWAMFKNLYGRPPSKAYSDIDIEPMSRALQGKVKSLMIAYAKGKAKGVLHA